VHNPFSTTFLRSLFERIVEGEGNKRTVNIFVVLEHVDGKRFVGSGGPVFRFLYDSSDQVRIAMDTGPDQTQLMRASEFSLSFASMWGRGELFSLPLSGFSGLFSTAPEIYLITGGLNLR
jgi:hypothetical protein